MNPPMTDKQIDWEQIRRTLLPDDAEKLLPDRWKLPVPSQTVTQFLEHANRSDYQVSKLVQIIEQDTNLTCELLRHVNAASNGMRHRISTVRQALVVLGIRRSKMLMLTAAIHSSIRKFNTRLFDLHQFWADNLERARFAREVAHELGADTEIAYTGAMLQDFLLPVLGQSNLPTYMDYWSQADKRPCDLCEYELSKFGVHHAQVGAICLKKWNVSDELLCSVLCQHMNYEELSRLGLLGTHVHAVAASSLIPTKILQHKNLAIPLAAWDQQDDSFDLFEVANRLKQNDVADFIETDPQVSLVDRIEHCLSMHLCSNLLSESMVNRQFGNFVLEECIGIGATGSVYRARHIMMNRPAAVKILNQDKLSSEHIARFEREVQLTSRLQHPNTVSIYDYGRTPDGLFYYAMELVQGISLKQLVQMHGPQSPGRTIQILEQICGSLDEAHQAGMIHRDIKPENILLSSRYENCDHVTVLDFGLVLDTQDDAEPNNSGLTGTPLYLAPESIDSPGQAQIASDIYSIGAVGYYLLTGQPLFTGNDAIDICLKQLKEAPQSPSERLGEPLPEDLETLIMRCLHKHPELRPVSATSLIEELQQCQDVRSWTRQQCGLWWTQYSGQVPEYVDETLLGRDDPTLLGDEQLTV